MNKWHACPGSYTSIGGIVSFAHDAQDAREAGGTTVAMRVYAEAGRPGLGIRSRTAIPALGGGERGQTTTHIGRNKGSRGGRPGRTGSRM